MELKAKATFETFFFQGVGVRIAGGGVFAVAGQDGFDAVGVAVGIFEPVLVEMMGGVHCKFGVRVGHVVHLSGLVKMTVTAGIVATAWKNQPEVISE